MTNRIKTVMSHYRIQWLRFALLTVLPCAAVSAELSMPAIFSDHMVLQRQLPVPVWGTATPGEEVEIQFRGQHFSARTNAQGQWKINMPPMEAGGPFTMSVKSGSARRQFREVFVGEVWLAAGQSNMAFRFSHSKQDEQIAALAVMHDLNLRMYEVPKVVSGGKLLERRDQPWAVAEKPVMGDWSAVSVYFAQALHLDHSVAIGIINASQGSSTIEAWMSRDAVAQAEVAGYVPDGKFTDIRRHYRNPSVLHETMLAGIIPYAIRGVIWYQGESNTADAASYGILLPTMIASWRKMWGQEKLPFIFAQLPAYQPPQDKSGETWARFRAVQADVDNSVPGTGMAVLIDTGEKDNIHPAGKKVVGERLADIARAQVYGEDIVYRGPSLKSVQYQGSAAIIEFYEAEDGLVAKGDAKYGFFVIDGGGTWRAATAELESNNIIVRHPEGKSILGVRYGWSNAPRINLYNRYNYPAVPFSVMKTKE